MNFLDYITMRGVPPSSLSSSSLVVPVEMMAKNDSTTTTAVIPNTKPYGKIILSLQNCLLPVDKLSVTPSGADGLDRDMETDLRILGCELIQTAGILLRLPQVAMATGQVLFQRFFHSKSFIKHSMEIVAMGCMCLASKIEEAPRRIRDVINVFHHIKQVRYKKTVLPMILDQNYINLKNQVIKAERRVLKELGFCVHVKHPHKIIVLYLQVLECERNSRLMQTSWNYMNDSLRTDVFLRYHPETVACACIYLSARQLKVPLPNKPAWFLIFGATEEEIQDICATVLHLYARKKADYESIEKVIEDIRKTQLEAKLKAKGLSGNDTPQAANFSPSSRPVSPRQDKSPEPKDKNRNDRKTNSDRSPKNRETNHVKKHSHSPESNKSGGPNSHSSRSGSPSPKRKLRTPPRGYKDSRKSPSLSRSRSRSNDRTIKDISTNVIKHRGYHKRRRSHSGSRSYSRSPHRSAIVSSKKGHHNKESKNRYKSRSRSRDRARERNHRERDHSRSRSRSYDKYRKSRKVRQNARDNRHRSRSRERGRH